MNKKLSNESKNVNANENDKANSQIQDAQSNGFGITGFTLSLVGLLIVPFFFGILAIIFSAIGMSKGQKYATAGLIIGIFDLFWTFIMLAFGIALMSSLF